VTVSLISTLLGSAPDQAVLTPATGGTTTLANTDDAPAPAFEAFFAEQLAVLDGQQLAGETALPALAMPEPILVGPSTPSSEASTATSALPALPPDAASADRLVAASASPTDDLLLAGAPTQRAAAGNGSLRELSGDIRMGQRDVRSANGAEPKLTNAARLAEDASTSDLVRFTPTVETTVRRTMTPETAAPIGGSEQVAAQNSAQAGSLTASPATGSVMLSPATPFTGVLSEAQSLSSAPSMELTQPFGSEQWEQELGSRLHWMADTRVGRAELRLNPPELGPLEVSLNVSNDEVSVSFQAQHAATREAVENALPRLREMMAQSGLNLADANVSQQQSQQQQQQQQELANQQRHSPGGGVDGADGLNDPSAVSASLGGGTRALGLLDAYA
jgi:flagellar hook-length control protein FliK